MSNLDLRREVGEVANFSAYLESEIASARAGMARTKPDIERHAAYRQLINLEYIQAAYLNSRKGVPKPRPIGGRD